MNKFFLGTVAIAAMAFTGAAAHAETRLSVNVGNPAPVYYTAPVVSEPYETRYRTTTYAPEYYNRRHGDRNWRYWHKRDEKFCRGRGNPHCNDRN